MYENYTAYFHLQNPSTIGLVLACVAIGGAAKVTGKERGKRGGHTHASLEQNVGWQRIIYHHLFV